MEETTCRDTTLVWLKAAYRIRTFSDRGRCELVGDYGPLVYDPVDMRYYFKHASTAVLSDLNK